MIYPLNDDALPVLDPQVRHLLHTADFAKQQRLLSLIKLLGELYNDLVRAGAERPHRPMGHAAPL